MDGDSVATAAKGTVYPHVRQFVLVRVHLVYTEWLSAIASLFLDGLTL